MSENEKMFEEAFKCMEYHYPFEDFVAYFENVPRGTLQLIWDMAYYVRHTYCWWCDQNAKPAEGTTILKREYSELFDNERKRRVELSFYKYGAARDNFASGRVDALATAELCLDAFKKDKNLEHLVDAANYLMFRFKYKLDGDYFKATDSDRSVGTVGTPINMEREQ